MKFRKRVKLFPGVFINFSKSGISTTIGVRGASVNLNKKGAYLNTGIPGTGLYDRQKLDWNPENLNEKVKKEGQSEEFPNQEIGAIKSKQSESVTTQGLLQLKKTLLDCYQERIELKKEIVKVKIKLSLVVFLQIISLLLVIGLFVKWFNNFRVQTKEYLEDLTGQLFNCHVDIDISLDSDIDEKYLNLFESYKRLIVSNKIWDITSSIEVNQKVTRSAASNSVKRRQVNFTVENMEIIKSKFDALHFENANGGDLYVYPAFIAIVDSKMKFGLIDIREMNFEFQGQRFLEIESIPKDTEVVGETWAKVNKNGSPDKRFKENYEIPICLYGSFTLSSNSGLNEAYLISNFQSAENFASAMREFQKAMK